VESGLGLARGALEASREVLAEYGNMSSPTVLFILERLRQRGAAGPCVALGFGPGLAAEAALFC
jgi:predicted naringenin-chalcone synthase